MTRNFRITLAAVRDSLVSQADVEPLGPEYLGWALSLVGRELPCGVDEDGLATVWDRRDDLYIGLQVDLLEAVES